MPMPMPIIIPSGGGGKATPEMINVLIGSFCVINIIALVVLLFWVFKTLKRRGKLVNENKQITNRNYWRDTNVFRLLWSELEFTGAGIFLSLVGIVWCIIIIVWLGHLIGNSGIFW